MDSKGWISVHRSIQDHWLWEDKPFSRGQAWIDLVMMANHKENRFVLGNELISVERGEFVTSELKLMERWGWGKSRTRAFLNLLQDDKMILKKTDRKKTTIKLVNYSVYQDTETTDVPQADYEQTTDFDDFSKNDGFSYLKATNKQTNANAVNSTVESDSKTTKEPHTDYEQTASKPRADTNNNINNDNKNSASIIDDFFEEIWSLYPNKKGKAAIKSATKKKLIKVGKDTLIKSLERYKRDLEVNTWKQPMNGSTWFNGRYADYLEAETEQPTVIDLTPKPNDFRRWE